VNAHDTRNAHIFNWPIFLSSINFFFNLAFFCNTSTSILSLTQTLSSSFFSIVTSFSGSTSSAHWKNLQFLSFCSEKKKSIQQKYLSQIKTLNTQNDFLTYSPVFTSPKKSPIVFLGSCFQKQQSFPTSANSWHRFRTSNLRRWRWSCRTLGSITPLHIGKA